MTQVLYAHMNNKTIINKQINKRGNKSPEKDLPLFWVFLLSFDFSLFLISISISCYLPLHPPGFFLPFFLCFCFLFKPIFLVLITSLSAALWLFSLNELSLLKMYHYKYLMKVWKPLQWSVQNIFGRKLSKCSYVSYSVLEYLIL
jgi:hypothetical protein